MKTIHIFAVLAILVICVAMFARADDDKDRSKREYENERKKEGARTLEKVKLENNEFAIRSKTKQPGRKDEIQFRFLNEPFPRFLLRYTSESGANKSVVANRWGIHKVIEFTSSDANAALGVGTSNFNVTSQLRLWGGEKSTEVKWSNFYGGATAINGVQVYNVCTDLTTKKGSNNIDFVNFRATVCAQIAESFVTLGSAGYADPSGFKWSISLANYPYQRSDSRLALKVGFRSISKAKTRTTSSGTQSTVLSLDTSSDGGVVAAWDPTVAITGTGCPATANVVNSDVLTSSPGFDPADANSPENSNSDDLPQTSQAWVYFSYVSTCQPASVSWDPQLAFSTSATSFATPFAAPSMVLLVLAALAALFAF